MSNLVQVMRTGHTYQADMASLALKAAQIPHFLREETSSGMRYAMPVSPSMGPGIWFVLLVPDGFRDEASRALAELPFEVSVTPDVWPTQDQDAWLRLMRFVLCFILGCWPCSSGWNSKASSLSPPCVPDAPLQEAGLGG